MIAAWGMTQPAAAKPVPYHTPQELKAKCKSAGGLYGPPTGNGVYTCQAKSGGGVVVCGGQGADEKTCEAARGAPAIGAGPVIRDHRAAPIGRDHRN